MTSLYIKEAYIHKKKILEKDVLQAVSGSPLNRKSLRTSEQESTE